MIALANGPEPEFEGMSSTCHFRHSSEVVRCLPVFGFGDLPLPKPVSHILETIYSSQLPPVFHNHNGIFGGTRYPLSLDAHSGCIYNTANPYFVQCFVVDHTVQVAPVCSLFGFKLAGTVELSGGP